MFYRAVITYENGYSRLQETELLKEICKMSFQTVSKQNQPAEDDNSCCACDEAVYEVGSSNMKLYK